MNAHRPDLRLAPPAIGAWLASLAVLHAGARFGVLLAAAAAVAAGVGAAVHYGRPACGVPVVWPWRGVPVVWPWRGVPVAWRAAAGGMTLGALLGVTVGATVCAARVAVRDSPAVAELTARRAEASVELTVRDDPRPLRGGPGRPVTYLVAGAARRIAPVEGSPLRLDARVVILAEDDGWRTVLPGQRVDATGRLAEPRGSDLTAAVLVAAGPPQWREKAPWHQRAAGALRAGLQRACEPLPDAPGGLLPGLVVGDTSALDPAVEDDFRATGMTHLVAVSGANVAIVIGAVLLLARWARAGPRLATAIALAALVGFVVLARPSPSVLRAGVMGALGLLALASARHRAALPALCAATGLLVLVDPELASDAGFALSVLATGGLLLLAPRWRDGLRRRGVPSGLAEAVAVPAAAQIACAPVVAGLNGAVSLVAVPANLLAVPAVAPATVLGVVAAVLSPVWPAGAQAAAWLGQWPAAWLVTVARYGARVPAGALPWPAGALGALILAVVLGALLVAARHPLVRRLVVVVVLAASLGALPVRLVAGGWPPDGWVAVACAVGQGDAVALSVSPRQAVVIDAGPDPSTVDNCLRRLDVVTVAVLVVSHFHADHVGGLEGVLRGRRVGAVVTTAWPEPATGRELVHAVARAHGVPVMAATAGWRYSAGALRLVALGPAERLTGTRSDPNNNSLAVRAEARGLRLLLVGDAEGEQQAALLAANGSAGIRADVLKVAHHGSPFQNPEFLDGAGSRVALVSVGAGNPYGHPNPAVLGRLARAGARIVRTDVSGDIAITFARGELAVVVRGVGHPP